MFYFASIIKFIIFVIQTIRNSNNLKHTAMTTLRNITVKEIFNNIQGLNPKTDEVSSLGSYISDSTMMVMQSVEREVLNYLSVDGLGRKILLSNTKNSLSEKQLWVISYELMKNEDYKQMLSERIEKENVRVSRKLNEQKTKLQNNKQSTQNVLDFVKENGFLLKDYYSFLKKTRQFSKEFYSKKYTMESGQSFINSQKN